MIHSIAVVSRVLGLLVLAPFAPLLLLMHVARALHSSGGSHERAECSKREALRMKNTEPEHKLAL